MLRTIINTLKDAFRKKQKPEPKRTPNYLDNPLARHTIRFRPSGAKPWLGPAFLARSEFHYVSRQTCRAALRAIQFQNVTARLGPTVSRRERRKYASVLARLEYRRMMADGVNAIPDTHASKYLTMTREELAQAI